MTTIIARMLEWLAALGSSVILLSATLPAARRRQLLDAYLGKPKLKEEVSQDALRPPYPYLETVGAAGHYSAAPEAEEKDRPIQLGLLHFAEDDWTGKARWLLDQVEQGGCVCWMANTVRRAQQTFAALMDIAPDDVDCTLLHAQFPLDERQRIENEIDNKYSKHDNGRRPPKGIVIGTQVLEQSLDIDFDLLVTDLAPIDLVLQRIGRLHRHQRDRFRHDRRAAAHPIPRVYVNYERDEAGRPRSGPDKFYGPYLLLKSEEIIAQRAADPGRFNLPTDYRPLIEWVYAEEPPPADHPWHAAWAEQAGQALKYQGKAEERLTNPPYPRRPFYGGEQPTFREEEDSAAWMAAQTRFQERETITLIPIERVDATTGRIPARDAIALDREADRATQLDLLRRSVRLSNPQVVRLVKDAPPLALFTQSALLRRCYPLLLVGEAAEGLPLRLDGKLGLMIERVTNTNGDDLLED